MHSFILCSLLVVLPKKHVYCIHVNSTLCVGVHTVQWTLQINLLLFLTCPTSKTCDWSMCALDSERPNWQSY